MAKMCQFCGGIVQTEGKDFPTCTMSGCICLGDEIEIQDGFAETIKILREKGYNVTGYKLPRLDGWETDFIASVVFNRHTVPATLPPLYCRMELPTLNTSIMFYRSYRQCSDFTETVKEDAEVLMVWASALQDYNGGMPEI